MTSVTYLLIHETVGTNEIKILCKSMKEDFVRRKLKKIKLTSETNIFVFKEDQVEEYEITETKIDTGYIFTNIETIIEKRHVYTYKIQKLVNTSDSEFYTLKKESIPSCLIYLKTQVSSWFAKYVAKKSNDIIIDTYNLFKYGVIPDFIPYNMLYIVGRYYCLKEDLENTLKYYLMGADEGCSKSMYALGNYYGYIEDNESMVKYYTLAVEQGSIKAARKLGTYYQNITDTDNMFKYYLRAIEKGCVSSMYNLGIYYCNVGDVDNMLKYYEMAAEKRCTGSIEELICWYGSNGDEESVQKYCDMLDNIYEDPKKN